MATEEAFFASVREVVQAKWGSSLFEDERLLYAYSMMLGTLDLDSIDVALRTIAVYGDKLEQQLSADDEY